MNAAKMIARFFKSLVRGAIWTSGFLTAVGNLIISLSAIGVLVWFMLHWPAFAHLMLVHS